MLVDERLSFMVGPTSEPSVKEVEEMRIRGKNSKELRNDWFVKFKTMDRKIKSKRVRSYN